MSPEFKGWDYQTVNRDDNMLAGQVLQKLLPDDLGFILIRVVPGTDGETVDSLIVCSNPSRNANKEILTGVIESMAGEPEDN